MKNKFSALLFATLLFLFSSFSFGAETATPTIADIKTNLISAMEKDGYLSQKMASEVAQKYISEADKVPISKAIQESKSVSWSEYLSWINFIKIVAVGFLLVAFSGAIKRVIEGLWHIIVAVPVIVYQSVFLTIGLFGIFRPDLIWESQYFYIATFFSFSNLIVFSWILETQPKIVEKIKQIFSFGIPISCVASFYGMVYFGILALSYESSLFGFFAVVCLSGVFSFGLHYSTGTLTLYFKENMLPSVVFGNLIVIIGYIAIFKTFPEHTTYFNSGIQYYCTIAMCVGLLVGAAPFYKSDVSLGYSLLFIVIAIFASFGYFFYDLQVMASIIFFFFILFILEWIGYLCIQTGFIIGSAIAGGTLFGIAKLFEHYGSMIILHL